MKKILMKNVGSGQHILLWPYNEDSIVVDFGVGCDNPHNPNIPTCSPLPWAYEKLIITHFHDDHYNGFYNISPHTTRPAFSFRNVFYPKMPQIVGSNAVSPFLVDVYVYAISLGISLSFQQTHYQNLYDFFNAIINNNSQPLIFTPVNKGFIITSSIHSIEILWPEQTIYKINEKPIEEIHHLFQDATIYNLQLSNIESFVRTVLLNHTDSFQSEFELTVRFINTHRSILSQISNTHLSKKGISTTRKLNKKLEDVLNKWSIAFMTSDDIIFLGDLNADQINKVCRSISQRNNKFDILVAAHHGTHSGFQLKKITVQNTIASIGSHLYGTKTQRQAYAAYNKISSTFTDTLHHSKDILI